MDELERLHLALENAEKAHLAGDEQAGEDAKAIAADIRELEKANKPTVEEPDDGHVNPGIGMGVGSAIGAIGSAPGAVSAIGEKLGEGIEKGKLKVPQPAVTETKGLTPVEKYAKAMHSETYGPVQDMSQAYQQGKNAQQFMRENPNYIVQPESGVILPRDFKQEALSLAEQKRINDSTMLKARSKALGFAKEIPGAVLEGAGKPGILRNTVKGGLAGYNLSNAYNEGLTPQGVLDAASGVSSAASMTRALPPKLKGLATILGFAAPLARKLREEPEEKAVGGVVGYAKGSSVKSLLQTALGYLEHTPKKPNPEVGTRFEREFVGSMAPRTDFDYAANKGSSLIVKPWDSQSRGQQIKSVSGIPLSQKIVTEGGNQFAQDLSNVQNKIGGASNEEIAKRIVNRAELARRENEMAGGSGKVFHSPITMGARGEDFAYTPTAVLSDLIKQREFNPTDMETLNNMVRGYNIPGKGQLLKNFVGFNDPRFTEQVLQGGHGLETTAGELRKGIMNRGSTVGGQKLINYNEADLRNALQNENLQGLGKGFTGDTLIEALPGELRPSSHTAYSHEYPGMYAGSGSSMPIEVVAPDVFENLFKEFQTQYPNKDYDTLRRMTIGAMEKRNQGVSQMINDRVIDTTGKFNEGLREGKFEPGNIGGALEHVFGINPYAGGFEGKFAEGGLTTPDEV